VKKGILCHKNMDFSIICRFCMAKDGPMMDIFKDTAMIAKANALLPNLKVRLRCECGSFFRAV
jgi:hypothetical protein